MSQPRVWHFQDRARPQTAIYVGRPSLLGNPFRMNGEADRDRVCDAFEEWIKTKPFLIQKIKDELRGKDLVCWCAPKRCHADTILRIANE